MISIVIKGWKIRKLCDRYTGVKVELVRYIENELRLIDNYITQEDYMKMKMTEIHYLSRHIPKENIYRSKGSLLHHSTFICLSNTFHLMRNSKVL